MCCRRRIAKRCSACGLIDCFSGNIMRLRSVSRDEMAMYWGGKLEELLVSSSAGSSAGLVVLLCGA